MPNNVAFGVQAKGVGKASNDIDRLRDKFDKLQKTGGKGFAIGAGAVAAGAALGVMSQATSMLTDVLGDSIQAARDDQVSIQKLGSALRENIPAWDGNTAAIERVLKSRMKLGFSDDEQRESLATLATATHDVNKSLILEAGAMDIARAKNVTLEAASDAVAKAYAGNTKQLKSLIPGLNLGKNSAEALANAFAAVKGGAEDFAKTEEGRLIVAQTKVNESMEQFGYLVLPAVTDAMVGAANAAAGLGTTLDVLQHGVADNVEGQREQVAGATDLLSALALLFPAYGAISEATKTAAEDALAAADGFNVAGDNSVNMSESVKGAAFGNGGVVESMGGMEDAVTDWRDKYLSKTGDIMRRNNRMVDNFVDTTQDIIDDAFDPLETRADLHDTRMQIHADQEKLRNSESAEDHRQTADDIIESLDDEASSLLKLGKKHKLTAKDVDRFSDDVKTYYKSLGKKVPADIQRIIDRLRQLANMPDITKNVTINTRTQTGRAGNPGKVGTPERARGGPVKKGQPYLVGEEGPEPFIPDQDGTIIPHGQASGGGSAIGGGGVTYNVYVTAGAGSGLTAGGARQLAAELGPAIYADMQRKGLLPRHGTGLTG